MLPTISVVNDGPHQQQTASAVVTRLPGCRSIYLLRLRVDLKEKQEKEKQVKRKEQVNSNKEFYFYFLFLTYLSSRVESSRVERSRTRRSRAVNCIYGPTDGRTVGVLAFLGVPLF